MNRRAVCAMALGGVIAACGKKKTVARAPAAAPAPKGITPGGITPGSPAPAASAAAAGSIERGLASWYGHPYHGRRAADGEIYDMETMVAAHKTLPFNTWVRVVNLRNNKTVEVRIIDRGPFVEGRIIDLSRAAANAIDLIGPGVGPVRIEV